MPDPAPSAAPFDRADLRALLAPKAEQLELFAA